MIPIFRFSLRRLSLFLVFSLFSTCVEAQHYGGIDNLFTPRYIHILEGKRVAVLTNNSAIDSHGIPSYQRLKAEMRKSDSWTISHFFAPEHGFWGQKHAYISVEDEKDEDGITIYSLHGSTRRPSPRMLENIDTILVDIQDIGARNYTYASTVFYVMEAAALKGIHVVVLDRPNPMGRVTDGPGVEDNVRSFIGYIDVPLNHGMSIGELANYFHHHYLKRGELTVVPYYSPRNEHLREDDWWAPTSPHIPSIQSARGFSLTTVIASLSWVNIGVGYTLPFQLIGAPWIDGNALSKRLNQLKLPGLFFHRWAFTPFFGLFSGQHCDGVRIVITDLKALKPFTAQVEVLHLLYTMYPKDYAAMLSKIDKNKWTMLSKATGITNIQEILSHPKTMRKELLKHNTSTEERLKGLRQYYLYDE